MRHRRVILADYSRPLRAAGAVLFLLALIPVRDLSSQSATRSTGAALVRQYANTDFGFRLLREPAVRTALVRLLGDRLPHLERNLDVSGSVDVIDGSLAVSGIAPHHGGEEEAIVCIVTYDLSVHAAILSGRTIELFTPNASYTNVPLCIKDWITQINSGHRDRFDPPGNVRVVTRH
jgi:hypothetical protein